MIISTTVAGDGTWSVVVPPGQDLPPGTYDVSARQTVGTVFSSWTTTQRLIVREYGAAARAFVEALPEVPTDDYVDRVNNLIAALVAGGVWPRISSLFDHACPITGGRLINMAAPGLRNATLVNALTHTSRGLRGDGTSGYISYGAISDHTLYQCGDRHFGVISSGLNGATVKESAGLVGTNQGNGPFLNPHNGASALSSRFSQMTTGTDSTDRASQVSDLGLSLLSRTSTATYDRYRHAALLDTVTKLDEPFPDMSGFQLRALGGVSTTVFGTREVSFFCMGAGLTAPQAAALAAALTDFYANRGVTV